MVSATQNTTGFDSFSRGGSGVRHQPRAGPGVTTEHPGPGHESAWTGSSSPGRRGPAEQPGRRVNWECGPDRPTIPMPVVPQPASDRRVAHTREREQQEAGIAALIALAQATEMTTLVRTVRAPVAVPSPAVPSRPRHRRQAAARKISILGIIAVVAALVATWLITRWPAARWLVCTAWMMPLIELGLLVIGQARFRWGFCRAQPGTFRQLIIQITTAGREQDRVNEIIRQIRSYGLSMPYQVWVVTEPAHPNYYPQADQVLVVPGNFSARSQKKARALEYSRRIRKVEGLSRPDVKIIFNDDDVTLTKGYIERAFVADYDICEGVVTPRTHYAVWPLSHFVASHADDIRTHACLVYCSVFQGILGRPLHVHGEGMVVTGKAEDIVTWDWPVIASEDLVFGQRAASAGLKWGWFHEYAEVTSPWVLKDYLVQRRRWLWGDIHAIGHRDVMPLGAAVMVFAKYLAGVTVLLCSAAGLYLRLTGRIPATAGVLNYAKLSILAWTGMFFACGWIGASSDDGGRTADSRLLSGVLAVLASPASLLLTLAGIVVPLVQGNPRSFAVIAKTRAPR